jgi:hypothetical protein
MTGSIRRAILLPTSRTERWHRWIGERFSQASSRQRSERPMSLEARKLKQLVELPLHGAKDWVKVRLLKGQVASGAGVYWPIIPKWGDRQVCLIT